MLQLTHCWKNQKPLKQTQIGIVMIIIGLQITKRPAERQKSACIGRAFSSKYICPFAMRSYYNFELDLERERVAMRTTKLSDYVLKSCKK